jgi:hypothetical protein
MTRRRPLTLERLEDRCVPVTWGNPWPDAGHVTISFAPDGTNAGGQLSRLFHTFSSADWQSQILRAFQAWVANANINLGLVADGGQAFGSAGAPQSDSRFGDIRLAATPAGTSVLAYTAPFDPVAGTLSGDIRINSDVWSQPNGGGYDLYTALLQEAGHAFGLPNSSDPTSVMYENYLGPRSGPSAGDIAALQALYGPRRPDAYEGASGNGTLATATPLSLVADSNGVGSIGVQADLSTTTDVDVYRFNAPSVTGGLCITLGRAGYSLLTPRVTVYNSLGQVVGSAVSTNPTGGDLVINLSSVMPLGTYYVAVQGASGSVFDVGGYRLSIQSLPVVNSLVGGLNNTLSNTTSGLISTLPLNDSFASALLLPSLNQQTSSVFDDAYRGNLNPASPVNYYAVHAPQIAAGDNALVVECWRLGASQMQPRVTLYDANQQPLSAQVLVNADGTHTLQLVGATPGALYYVKVEAASGMSQTGDNYFLGVDFSPRAIHLQTFADSTLSASTPSLSGTMAVSHTATFHFVLAADSSPGTTVRLTIRDNAGTIIRVLDVASGNALSLNLTLTPGNYTFTFTAYRSDGQPIPAVHFTLTGERLTDPAGPQPTDSTSNPSQPPPSGTGSGSTTSSGGSTNDDGYWYSWYYQSNNNGGVSPAP